MAFPRFKLTEQLVFIENLNNYREGLERDGQETTGITLTEPQAALLARLAKRVELPYEPAERHFSFAVIDEMTPQQLTDYEDPEVTKLLTTAPDDDKIGYLFRHIQTLTEKQKVKLLLTLSPGEYEEYKRRRQEGFAHLAADIDADPALIPDRTDRIQAKSRLRYATPRYEAAAEMRRRYMEDGDSYPLSWDAEFDEAWVKRLGL